MRYDLLVNYISIYTSLFFYTVVIFFCSFVCVCVCVSLSLSLSLSLSYTFVFSFETSHFFLTLIITLWTPIISLSMYLTASCNFIDFYENYFFPTFTQKRDELTQNGWIVYRVQTFFYLTGFHGILKQKGFVYKTHFYNNGCIVSYRLYKQSSLRTKNSQRALFLPIINQ